MVDNSIPPVEREEAAPAGAIPQIDLAHFFSVLRGGLIGIIAITVLFAGAAVGFSLLLKNYYISTVSILVDPEGSQIVEGEIYSDNRATEARTLNQQYILTSVRVLAAVVESESLVDDPEFGAAKPFETDRQKRVQRALDALQKAIVADLNKASFVIDLSVTSSDPVKSARLANAVADTYIQTRIQMNNGVLRQATTDLSAQLASLEKAVEDGDRAVQAYKAKYNIIDVGGRPTAEQQIAETNSEITRISGTIAENEALMSELVLARSNPEYLRYTPDTSLTPAIIELRTRYHAALEQQSVLQSSFGERHPALQSARARTQAVSALLNTQLKDFETSLARNAEKLKSQRQLLLDNLAVLKSSLNESDESMVQLRELERKLASDRLVYESFLLRTRQLSGQERTISENPQIISAGQVPLGKAGPRRSLIVAGATILGFLVGCGLALARDIRPSADGRSVPAAPAPAEPASIETSPPEREPRRRTVWAWLRRKAAQEPGPFADNDIMVPEEAPVVVTNRRTRVTGPIEDVGDVYAAATRQLIQQTDVQSNHCIVLYASDLHRNGHRTAMHLAKALAETGKNLLLVDAETEANLTRQAAAAGKPGLLDAISLQRIEGDFVNPDRTPGLWLMPAGRRSPRVSTKGVFKSQSLVDWLEADGLQFDLVLVYAGRSDQQRAIPAIETSAASFAVLGNWFNRKDAEDTVSVLQQRGLSPVIPLYLDEDLDSMPRAG
ncbi:MAG: exopolysaccharide transport family protein [Rhizobium sp.]|nr:exopolysaccharide transport family protein [Rhizobium sp.]